VSRAEALGEEDLQSSSKQLGAVVTEELLGLAVDGDDAARRIRDDGPSTR